MSAFLVGYCAVGCWYDWHRREIPNWLPLAGILLGMLGREVGWWSWSYLWMLVVTVPLLIADVGKGDVKASMVLGGAFGAWSSAIVLLAFGLLIPFWIAYRAGWPHYPGTWPFFPLLTGAACVILLAGAI